MKNNINLIREIIIIIILIIFRTKTIKIQHIKLTQYIANIVKLIQLIVSSLRLKIFERGLPLYSVKLPRISEQNK